MPDDTGDFSSPAPVPAPPGESPTGSGALRIQDADKGASTSSFADPDGALRSSDARMIRRAVREKWPVTPDLRERVVELIRSRLTADNVDDRVLVNLARTLLDADKLNLAGAEFEDRRERLDEGHATSNVAWRISFNEAPPPQPGVKDVVICDVDRSPTHRQLPPLRAANDPHVSGDQPEPASEAEQAVVCRASWPGRGDDERVIRDARVDAPDGP